MNYKLVGILLCAFLVLGCSQSTQSPKLISFLGYAVKAAHKSDSKEFKEVAGMLQSLKEVKQFPAEFQKEPAIFFADNVSTEMKKYGFTAMTIGMFMESRNAIVIVTPEKKLDERAIGCLLLHEGLHMYRKLHGQLASDFTTKVGHLMEEADVYNRHMKVFEAQLTETERELEKQLRRELLEKCFLPSSYENGWSREYTRLVMIEWQRLEESAWKSRLEKYDQLYRGMLTQLVLFRALDEQLGNEDRAMMAKVFVVNVLELASKIAG